MLGNNRQFQSEETSEAAFRQAAADGDVDALYALSRRISSVDCQGQSGKKTALHLAAKSGKIEAVKMLITLGANLEVKDANDKKAIDLATDEKTRALLQLVMELKQVTQDTRTKSTTKQALSSDERDAINAQNRAQVKRMKELGEGYQTVFTEGLVRCIQGTLQDSHTLNQTCQNLITKQLIPLNFLQRDQAWATAGCQVLITKMADVLLLGLWQYKAMLTSCKALNRDIYAVSANKDIIYMRLAFVRLISNVDIITLDITDHQRLRESKGVYDSNLADCGIVVVNKANEAILSKCASWGEDSIMINPASGAVFFTKYRQYGTDALLSAYNDTIEQILSVSDQHPEIELIYPLLPEQIRSFIKNAHNELIAEIESLAAEVFRSGLHASSSSSSIAGPSAEASAANTLAGMSSGR